MVCVSTRQSLRRLAGFFCVFMQKDLVFDSFLEYNLGMATVTQNHLADLAYQAGLRGHESITCPRSYLGWVIPEMFEDGAMAFGIWRHFWAEGQRVEREACARDYDDSRLDY